MDHVRWMQRCLQLARLAEGHAAPNPLVGAVLVHGQQVLAEGWHHTVGRPHAEVECLREQPGPIPADAVLYVNLEPCAHHGRTPPCADLLIDRGVRHVVVGMIDPDPRVQGQGIERLRNAGVQVTVGVEEAACRWTNRRFITSIEAGRPYVVLKWARSADGLLDQHPRTARGVQRISAPVTDVSVHQWRAQEQAILVGSRTVVEDDPALTVRAVDGRSPLRVVIDRSGITPAGSQVHDGSTPTLLFTAVQRPTVPVEQVVVPTGADIIGTALHELHRRGIRSVLVEGGAELLGHFIASGRWDEARIIQGTPFFGSGTPAPTAPGQHQRTILSGPDRIDIRTRTLTIDPAWPL